MMWWFRDYVSYILLFRTFAYPLESLEGVSMPRRRAGSFIRNFQNIRISSICAAFDIKAVDLSVLALRRES
ncbi:hypothetical protein DFP73DRAFT_566109 [Morchella snyderi]|nr:hypothetical protein DFP73DRAFT_566109 [Morchella snyderi]